MPINILKDTIIKHLDTIGFRKVNKDFSCSPQDCLKNILLRDLNVDVAVIDQSKFRVSFQADRYYESVVSDYYFSLQKVNRQRESLNNLLENSGPGAWMLVTAYYQAFYAATQIARLTGKYSFYLDASLTNCIKNRSESPWQIKKGVYSGVKISLDEENNSVVIHFSKLAKEQHSHTFTWTNIYNCISSDDQIATITEHKRVSRISLFKEIVGTTNKSEPPMLSRLRNDWNYSRVDAYALSSDQKLEQLKYILQGNHFNRTEDWCDQNERGLADESDPSAALGYVCQVLDSVMKNVSNRLL